MPFVWAWGVLMEKFEVIKRRYERYEVEFNDQTRWGSTPNRCHRLYLDDVRALLSYYDDLEETFEKAWMYDDLCK